MLQLDAYFQKVGYRVSDRTPPLPAAPQLPVLPIRANLTVSAVSAWSF